MKKISLWLMFFVFSLSLLSQEKFVAYKDGETLKYLVHYGFIDGGYAMLNLKEFEMNGKEYFHAVASGYSTGLADKLFKVRDVYETFVDKETDLPIKAIRNINRYLRKYY